MVDEDALEVELREEVEVEVLDDSELLFEGLRTVDAEDPLLLELVVKLVEAAEDDEDVGPADPKSTK